MTRRRGHFVAWLLVAVIAASACAEQSRVDPDATVRVGGTVHAPDGSPLAGRPVKLGGGVGASDGLLAVLTLGLSCIGGGCTGRVFDTTTDAGGRYEFVLKGSDTQSTFGAALRQQVTVSAAPGPAHVSGATISAGFRVQVEDVRLPVLDLVDPGLTVEPGPAVAARWSTARPGPYDLTFEEATTVPVWEGTTQQPSASVDPRLLEDTSGRVVVSGRSQDRIEGSDLAVRWRSPGVPYAAGAGPPPSRGRQCRWEGPGGDTVVQERGCGLTDGDLTRSVSPPSVCAAQPAATAGSPSTTARPCPIAVAVVVELSGPVPAELVVVRGCSSACTVDISVDGTSYRPAGSVSDGHGLVALNGQPTRSVRVDIGSSTSTSLSEVSVWGPRPSSPSLLTLVGADRARVGRQFSDGGDDREVPGPLIAVAIALLVAALVGVGFVAGRRHTQ